MIKPEHLEQLRKMVNEDEHAWAVISALRGPDYRMSHFGDMDGNVALRVKMLTTAVLRYCILEGTGVNYGWEDRMDIRTPRGAKTDWNRYTSVQKNEVINWLKLHPHFWQHITDGLLGSTSTGREYYTWLLNQVRHSNGTWINY